MPDAAPPPSQHISALDALLPDAVARKAEAAGIAKADREITRLFALSVLAGAFIAMGALFSTIVATGAGVAIHFGLIKLLTGLAFSLGLVMVVIGGAELFTGDVLMVMAAASGRLSLARMLRAWAVVYVGNFVGAIGTAALAFLAGHHEGANGAIGATILAIAEAKAQLPFFKALFLGILCNVLVCMAVWASLAARSATDKILVIVPPVAAFVAAGFEHSVANMYTLPYALALKCLAGADFWSAIGRLPGDFSALTLGGFAHNLFAVSIGNVIGGGLLVGAVYWFIFLRPQQPKK
jgi:formate transporter